LRFAGAGIVTFGEAAGGNTPFMASAIGEPAPTGRFSDFLVQTAGSGNKIGVCETRNVIVTAVFSHDQKPPKPSSRERRRLRSIAPMQA
jgi:hypothetical protein